MIGSTDLSLPLSVPSAIRLHGYLTEHIARDRHKLDALATMRAGISDEPDLSEQLIAANIKSDGQLLADLSTLLYGDSE